MLSYGMRIVPQAVAWCGAGLGCVSAVCIPLKLSDSGIEQQAGALSCVI
jgi:hypothetical protein